MSDQLWIETLSRIDAEFYEAYGSSFDRTRREPWQGWATILESFVRPRAFDSRGEAPAYRVVDLGCGNARFFQAVREHRPAGLSYLGLDRSDTLLELAHRRGHDSAHPVDEVSTFELRSCDVLDAGALSRLLEQWPKFDLAVAFGLMHHLPTAQRRRAVLEAACASLESGGHLAVSFWRFDRDPRIAARALALTDSDSLTELRRSRPEVVELAAANAEVGDHLMPWGESGDRRAMRYCHCFDDREIDSIAQHIASSRDEFELVADFAADGRSGDMNRYLVWQRG